MIAVVETYTFDNDTSVVLFDKECDAYAYVERRWKQCMESEKKVQEEEDEENRTLVEDVCTLYPDSGMGIMAWLHDPYNSSETLDNYDPEHLDYWYIQAVAVENPKV